MDALVARPSKNYFVTDRAGETFETFEVGAVGATRLLAFVPIGMGLWTMC